MGDHFVFLVDHLLTESTLESAIKNRNPKQLVQSTIEETNTGCSYSEVYMTPRKIVECKICHEEDLESNMETPCSCRGSLKWFKPDYTAPLGADRYGRLIRGYRVASFYPTYAEDYADNTFCRSATVILIAASTCTISLFAVSDSSDFKPQSSKHSWLSRGVFLLFGNGKVIRIVHHLSFCRMNNLSNSRTSISKLVKEKPTDPVFDKKLNFLDLKEHKEFTNLNDAQISKIKTISSKWLSTGALTLFPMNTNLVIWLMDRVHKESLQ
nr:Protein of unknown function DUF3675 [Ipomoea batatas]